MFKVTFFEHEKTSNLQLAFLFADVIDDDINQEKLPYYFLLLLGFSILHLLLALSAASLLPCDQKCMHISLFEAFSCVKMRPWTFQWDLRMSRWFERFLAIIRATMTPNRSLFGKPPGTSLTIYLLIWTMSHINRSFHQRHRDEPLMIGGEGTGQKRGKKLYCYLHRKKSQLNNLQEKKTQHNNLEVFRELSFFTGRVVICLRDG